MVGSLLMKCTKLDKYFSNPYGTLHGAAMVTYMDLFTGLVVMAFDINSRDHVSINMSINFMNAAKIEDSPVYFLVKLIKLGKSVAFMEMDILDKDKRIISKMTHNKAIISSMSMEKNLNNLLFP